MQTNFTTERLQLEPLTHKHAAFIFELVNTSGWIKYIGDRNVYTTENAIEYIEKINNNEAIRYWVVNCIYENLAIGLVTLIKRDYLEHHDIGFAFLPQYTSKGYAYEAANKLLQYLLKDAGHKHIDACTLPENISSINLLEKLGLKFKEQITHHGDLLSIYSI